MTSYVGADGIWCQVLRPGAVAVLRGRPGLFLDRDGVVVEEVGYLPRPQDVRLISGAEQVIAEANRRRLAVVIVTNQSGIGRGTYGWPAFAATQARICAKLARAGACLDMVLACPFHGAAEPPYRHADHPFRKPRPGMITRAGEVLKLDLAASWIVGDRASDLAAGRAAGLAGGVLVATGHGRAEGAAARQLAGPGFQVSTAASVAEILAGPLSSAFG